MNATQIQDELDRQRIAAESLQKRYRELQRRFADRDTIIAVTRTFREWQRVLARIVELEAMQKKASRETLFLSNR